MHRISRDALPNANADNRLVVVLNMDIRDFTSHSGPGMESVEAAIFLKIVYGRLLEDYFAGASFWKGAGDGLIVVFEHQDNELSQTLQTAADLATRIVADFPGFANGDPRINFETPSSVGIGIAFGAASRLESGDLILDYFGKPLNLSSRLVDLARPKGVVIDDATLLSPESRRLFRREWVYLKGIAEREPRQIWVTRRDTRVPSISRVPLVEPEWVRLTPRTPTLNQLRKGAAEDVHLAWTLAERPVGDEVDFTVGFPQRTPSGGKGATTLSDTLRVGKEYELYRQRGTTRIRVKTAQLVDLLDERGVKGTWRVSLDIAYPRLPRPKKRRSRQP